MPKESTPPSFDAFIKDARQKKKNEALAAQIFRRSSSQSSVRSPTTASGSMASRVGINKRPQNSRFGSQTSLAGSRSNSTSNLRQQGPRNPPSFNRPPAAPRALANKNSYGADSYNGNSSRDDGGGISVRGMGGSTIVIAQNFAPGTTAADIESVLAPDAERGLVACQLIASNPTVIASLTFSSLDEADRVVETFNNKMADGRLLHVYIQEQRDDKYRGRQPYQPPQSRAAPQPNRSYNAPQSYNDNYNDSYRDEDNGMDVDYEDRNGRRSRGGYANNNNNHPNNNSGWGNSSASRTRAQPQVQDGSYGFVEDGGYAERAQDDRGRQSDRRGRGRGRGGGLVSDGLVGGGGGGGRQSQGQWGRR